MAHKRRLHDHPPDYRPAKPSRNLSGRIFWMVVIGGIVSVAVYQTRSSISSVEVVTPPGPVKMARMRPGTMMETAERNGIDGGARAGFSEVMSKETAQISTQPVTVHEVVSSKISLRDVTSKLPHVSKDKALEDAIQQAREQLAEKLANLDPPIHVVPNNETIRTEYVTRTRLEDPTPELRSDWERSGLDSNRFWAKLDVEVSEQQLRNLRAKERFVGNAKWAGGFLAIMAALYAFLRLDRWSRGYLTIVLSLGIIGLTTGAIVALFAI